MADYKVSDTQLTAVANAIRSKKGSSGQLAFPDGFVSEVESITANVSSGNKTIYVPLNISKLSAYEAVDTGVTLDGGITSPIGNIHHWSVTGTPPRWFDSIEFYVVYSVNKWKVYIRNKTNTQLTDLYKTVSVTYKVFTAQIK